MGDPFLVFDAETTGTDPQSDRIVELGAAYVDGPRITRYRRRCHPGVPIPPEASAIHHIRDEHVQGEPPFAEIAERFLGLLADKGGRLCGYNVLAFDGPLLNAELHRAGRRERLDARAILDVIVFVRWHLRHLRTRDLGAVCLHHGIDLTEAHSAAADAQATGQLLQVLCARGHVPADWDAALIEQARLVVLLDEEWTRWSYWLYRDRRNGSLRLGCGKHCGRLLSDVDPGYLTYCLDKIADLPEEVRALFCRTSGGPDG